MALGDWVRIHDTNKIGQILHVSGERSYVVYPGWGGCTQEICRPGEYIPVTLDDVTAELNTWHTSCPAALIKTPPPFEVGEFVRPGIGNYFTAFVTSLSSEPPHWATLTVVWALEKMCEGASFPTCLWLQRTGLPKSKQPELKPAKSKLYVPQQRALTLQ